LAKNDFGRLSQSRTSVNPILSMAVLPSANTIVPCETPRAARAEAELAAAAGVVAGRGRVAAFESVALRVGLPAMASLARTAPRLRCDLLEAEPSRALPALARGDVDLVLGDEWRHQPVRLPAGVRRDELLTDPVRLVLPARHPVARRYVDAVPLAELAGEAWTTGYAGMGWDEMTHRACRELGGSRPTSATARTTRPSASRSSPAASP
jgi:hypothetical protein